MNMQNRVNALFDLTQMYQTIGVRRLVRFGITMGIALAGQILVTLSLGTLSWMQQHVFMMVVIELIWWPPFFLILYLSFSGVLKLVAEATRTHKNLRGQFDSVCDEYETRCATYEQKLLEQNISLNRLTRVVHKQLHVSRLEPIK